jgi:hypothetical protein
MKAAFHFSFTRALYARGTGRLIRPFSQRAVGGIYTMDEYQEELLEYQAFELDQPEPADDATEL